MQGKAKGMVRGRKNQDEMTRPSTLIHYDACAASEGTQEIPTHGIPSPHHSPGPALSVDSAAALTPIIGVVRKSSSEQQARVQHFGKGKASSKWSNGTGKTECIEIKCKQKKQVARERATAGNKKHEENGMP